MKAALALLLVSLLAQGGAEAAGARPPSSSWSSNLDAACNPDDIVDKLMAILSPRKFWTKERETFQSRIRGSLAGIENSTFLLTENRNGRQEFLIQVEKRADELGLKGDDRRRMIADNMADFDREATVFATNIEAQRRELEWAQGCLARIESELMRL